MVERTLIKQGLGGFTIYLPKKWVTKKGLSGGDTVSVTETETGLFLGSPVRGKRTHILRITDENRHDLAPVITHLYRRGYDAIVIEGLDAKLEKEVKETASLLLGFEVTAIEDGRATLENISEPTSEKYELLLRRVFFIIRETLRLLVQDFTAHTLAHGEDLRDLQRQQDRYVLFCRRLLVKERYEKNPVLHWELLTFLMHIEHAAQYLYAYAQKKKTPASAEVVELLRHLEAYFNLLYQAYFARSLAAVHRINRLKTEYQFGQCLRLLEEAKGAQAVMLSYIRELFRLIQIASSPILTELVSAGDQS